MNQELEALLQLAGVIAFAEVVGFAGLTAVFGLAQYKVDKETAQEMMHHYEAGRLSEKPTAWNIRRILADRDLYRELLIIDANEYVRTGVSYKRPRLANLS